MAAKFFHYVIAALLEELFGITAYGQGIPVKRNKGIFGKVALCIRTVKAQGRETLHLHMAVWLYGSLTSSKMKEVLCSSLFRSKIKNYIKANIWADIDSADENALKQMSCENCLSYSWPCDPHQFGHHGMVKAMECELASQCNTTNAVKMLALLSNKTTSNVNAEHLLKSQTVVTLMRMANGGPKEPTATSIIGVHQLCNALAATRTSN